MKKHVTIWKNVGETPLHAIEKYRENNHLEKEIKLAYAGRLDPMAQGRLLVLIGDECKKQDTYLRLDKEYEFEVLFGFSTDTGDVLGVCKEKSDTKIKICEKDLGQVALRLVGKQTFEYPRFSSKTVEGKQLHVWTLEGRLDEITIPKMAIEVYNLTLLGTKKIGKNELYTYIQKKIRSIPQVIEKSKALGRDFRRKEILAMWQAIFDEVDDDTHYCVATFRCVASSGTYMRTLAEMVGEGMGMPALALSIKRTKIGVYKKIFKNVGVWIRSY